MSNDIHERAAQEIIAEASMPLPMPERYEKVVKILRREYGSGKDCWRDIAHGADLRADGLEAKLAKAREALINILDLNRTPQNTDQIIARKALKEIGDA